MSNDTTRDRNTEEDENYEGANPELQDLPLPKTDSMLYLILNSLNQNIANFNAYLKFKNYISEDSLNAELLKRSMGIHRDFSALFFAHQRRTGIHLSGTSGESRKNTIQRGSRH